mgnify:CR=1 FL=1
MIKQNISSRRAADDRPYGFTFINYYLNTSFLPCLIKKLTVLSQNDVFLSNISLYLNNFLFFHAFHLILNMNCHQREINYIHYTNHFHLFLFLLLLPTLIKEYLSLILLEKKLFKFSYLIFFILISLLSSNSNLNVSQ